MAATTDKITDVRNGARPNSARVTSGRSPAGSTLACDNLAGWPTASKDHFVTYKLDSSSNPIAGSQMDCSGIVSGNNINSFTVIDGNDVGHAVGDVVEMLPTAAWGQDLATALTNQHDRTGAHTSITASTIATTGNATIGGNETVAGTLGVTGATTHAGAVTNSSTTVLTGAVSGAGYSMLNMANPYKFNVYRSAALNSGSTGNALITFDTVLFDTGSNYSVSTGKFTAPISGFYFFSARCSMTTGIHRFFLTLYKNGVEVLRGNDLVGATGAIVGATVSGLVQMTASDYIQVQNFYDTTAVALDTGVAINYLNGFLVSQT